MSQIRNHKISLLLLALLLIGALLFVGACSNNDTPPDSGQTGTTPTDDANTQDDSQDATDDQTAEAEPVELLIAAAASMRYSLENEITTLYKEAAPHVTLTFSLAGSGALQTQIEEGAPADVFISAAQKQMDALDEGGFLMAGSRRDLLENKVVLIVPAGSDKGISSFEDVASDKVGMVAIGEIASVPVGQYTEEIFTNMGLWDEIQANKTINYGADVTQVLTWVESGEVDCGIVYATDAATSDKVTVVATAPADSHSPVIYPVSVLARTEYPAEAQAFVDFLFTPEASAVFEQYGFTTGL